MASSGYGLGNQGTGQMEGGGCTERMEGIQTIFARGCCVVCYILYMGQFSQDRTLMQYLSLNWLGKLSGLKSGKTLDPVPTGLYHLLY